MPNIKKIKAKKMEQQKEARPIIIHHHLIQKFMKYGKDYSNLIALYSFYIYQAQLQKTNQPLSTDEFTKNGMSWGLDRVKRIKKILKEMKVISVVQKEKYYYIRLFFIYTKNKIAEVLGKNEEKSKVNLETEALAPKSDVAKLKPSVPSEKVPNIALERWLIYCNKNSVKYNKNHLNSWRNKLEKRVSIEQIEAVNSAINKKWKNFYITPIKESKYHHLLGKSLMMQRDCDTLLDIGFEEKKFVYRFKNITVRTTEPPVRLFERYGYDKKEMKSLPIAQSVKDKVLRLIKRF